MTRSRLLLAFKRGPTVDLQLDDLSAEVRGGRVHLTIRDEGEYFSWQEWNDFVRRVDHAIHWVEQHTPEDVTGVSFTVEESDA